jgi:hypothetical protein
MLAGQPSAKIYCSRFEVPLREFIGVWHSWIQRRRTGELLIDVHDYSHVHHGPGVILVAHECFYFMDQGDGRPGLAYRRRRGDQVPVHAGLRDAAAHAVRACVFLEEDLPGKIAFDASAILVGFDDRLAAPNTAEAFGTAYPELRALGDELYPDAEVQIAQAGEVPRGPLRASISAGTTIPIGALAARLG